MLNFSDNSNESDSESCFDAENKVNETDFNTNLMDFDTALMLKKEIR